MRRAFTLVELLVVMFLIAILATIAIAFFPNAASSAREARAAIAVQGWLNIAKQRALRDGQPRGVRFYVTTQTINGVTLPNMVAEAEYIEQPSDFNGGGSVSTVIREWNVATSYNFLDNVSFSGVTYYARGVSTGKRPDLFPAFWHANATIVNFAIDLSNGNGIKNPFLTNPPSNATDTNVNFFSVIPEDRLELDGGGLGYRIDTLLAANPAVPSSLPTRAIITPGMSYLPRTPGAPHVFSTTSYKITCGPRVTGESLKMTENVFIDLSTNFTYKRPVPAFVNNTMDVMFAPNGSLICKGFAGKTVDLWVRAPAQDNAADVFRGDPTIVSIFSHTGIVGAFAVDPVTAGNHYTLVR